MYFNASMKSLWSAEIGGAGVRVAKFDCDDICGIIIFITSNRIVVIFGLSNDFYKNLGKTEALLRKKEDD